MQLRKSGLPKASAEKQGRIKADEAFEGCVESLRMIMTQLRLPLTEHAKVSGAYSSLSYVVPALEFFLVRPGYRGEVSALSETTCNILRDVEHQLKGEAWMMWAVAQRASLPLKIEACVE
jgi:hypothetical protein